MKTKTLVTSVYISDENDAQFWR